ncbi:hypothetical protein HWV62_26312 [Athelia sp. TMB]|nr:hypothetical protein HWV62_26312 [Athelia sp. TMB]
MATSFAAYASQFLTKQQGASSLSSSQPLFYSFSTDEGSRIGHYNPGDLDDMDDPHLRASGASRVSKRQKADDSDYHTHHGDEDDDDPYLRLDEEEQLPGGSRYASQSIPFIGSLPGPSEPGSPKGWLAHQASPLGRSRSPSPSPSSSSYESHSPPAHVSRSPPPKPPRVQPPPPPTTRGPMGLSLTESLLPRDGQTRAVDVFSLPDPRHVRRRRWKFNDSPWTAVWCAGVTICFFFCILLLFITQKTKKPVTLPYTTLLHTVPLLTILTFVSAAVAYTHIFLLRIFVGPVMIATSVFIPATLFISAVWAFIGSFMWESGQEPTWGETVGSTLEWHVKGWANWAIVGTVIMWLWSWGVARGMLRTTAAAVIGAWYFADPILPPPPPTSTHTIHAALTRSSQPSLGTVILAALILTGVRMLGLLTTFLRFAPAYLPLAVRPFAQPVVIGCAMAVGWLDNVTTALSKYALVYVGLTGDPFFVAARRARALTAAVEGTSEGKYRRKFKTEPPLTLLTVAPLTLSFPFALSTYLFVAHTLNAPDQALGASILAGGVTALVGLFCVGLVKDTADTLYVCYCIDKDTGNKRRDEVFSVFEYDSRPQQPAQRHAPALPQSPPAQRQHQALSPQQAPPRRAQPQVLAQPAEDIDPFESAAFDAPAAPPPQVAPPHRQPLGYSVASRADLSDDDEGEGEDEESQLFPGSDLF